MGDMVPPGVRLGIVRSISYGLFGKPDRFVPQLRELGATLVRVYVYWRRELVMRNLLALSAGVRRTVCWNLAPDIPGYENPLSIMDLLFGKLVLMDYEGTELRRRYPSAETFALLAERLAGVEVDGVTRLEVPERPNLSVFEVRRRRRGPLLVVWEQRDAFDGEDEPPVAFDWPWPAAPPVAVDALGQTQPAEVLDGRVKLSVSLTPVFIAAD